MEGFLIRAVVVGIGLWLASKIVGGIAFSSTETLIAAALLLGIVNAFVRPIIVILTLPITLLTLGLFLPATVVASGHTSRVVLALFIGVTMCVSAIPVIAKTLSDMRLLHRNLGQLILAAGSIDDAVGWLLLSVVSAAAATGVRTGHVLVAVAYLIAFVLLAGTVGRVGVKKVLTATTRADEPGRARTARRLDSPGGRRRTPP